MTRVSVDDTRTYTVADYLLDRLAGEGVAHVFGVPGDFTLAFLDHVTARDDLEWVGCANELGAGYAADGYARLRGLAALSTTFGVGELSAIAAVAGSRAEHVPVLHIAGAPTTATQAAARATHHTLGDGDFGHFARMTAEVVAARAIVTADEYAAQIDEVIVQTRDRRLPGYLVLPADVSEAPAKRPDAPLPRHPGVTDPLVAADFRAALEAAVTDAASLAVLADILVARLSAEDALRETLDQGIPHATLLWGRRVVDESAPGYVGSYLGAASAPDVRAAVEDSDLVVLAGVQFTDLTSGFFTQRIDPRRAVELGGEGVTWNGHRFAPLAMVDALRVLADVVRTSGAHLARRAAPAAVDPSPVPAGSGALDQATLWRDVADFLRSGDVVLAEQGTAFYGMADHRLPAGVTFIGQPLWAAIGYTLPALLGAALARPDARPILLIGDGAAQMTVAELGTLLRHRIPAVIVVVDNGGYTVERVIHGPDAVYNDIAAWDWVALLGAMDHTGSARGIRVDTAEGLADALAVARKSTTLTLIQAVVPPMDVPPVLADVAAAAARANRRA